MHDQPGNNGRGTVTMSPTRHGSRARCRSRAPRPLARSGRNTAHLLQRTAATLAVSLVAVIAAGCSNASGVQTQPGPGPSDPTHAVASASPNNPSQLVGEAAIAQVGRYERVLDDLFLTPRTSVRKLYAVSTQPDVNNEIADINRFRAANDHQSGRTEVTSTRIDSVDLAGNPPTVRVTACVNVAAVRAIGPTGKSIVPKSRPTYYLTHLTLVNFKYPAKGAWLVKAVTNTGVAKCVA
jgi:hypothetical protein